MICTKKFSCRHKNVALGLVLKFQHSDQWVMDNTNELILKHPTEKVIYTSGGQNSYLITEIHKRS